MTDLRDFISDYSTSDRFLFLEPSLKESAESLLAHFLKEIGPAPSFAVFKASLRSMASLELPLSVRQRIPLLLADFFGFLSDSGRFPAAREWVGDVRILEKEYLNYFRTDGTVRGETYKKKTIDVGRNAPCPCGSGQKFKKCCLPLIS
ncbi:MAG: hypothetical protein A2293_12625 [Elusimicrobia bacterium RIFOXYB2_FULL_49_7]|nr:MAG: hypothetical protein A2293_12625 [Elusimicrobia bacterium RIFOXYB2_FULL_49_7]